MSASKEPSHYVATKSKAVRIVSLIAFVLCAIEILFAFVTFPFLPSLVPAQWSGGKPVDYISRWGYVSICIGLSLGWYLLSLGATALAKQGRGQKNVSPLVIMFFFISILNLFIELIIQLVITGLILH